MSTSERGRYTEFSKEEASAGTGSAAGSAKDIR
jgi:hypothetical protein